MFAKVTILTFFKTNTNKNILKDFAGFLKTYFTSNESKSNNFKINTKPLTRFDDNIFLDLAVFYD